MDFRHLIVTCLFSMLRLPFDNQKVKENYAIFIRKMSEKMATMQELPSEYGLIFGYSERLKAIQDPDGKLHQLRSMNSDTLHTIGLSLNCLALIELKILCWRMEYSRKVGLGESNLHL